MKINKIIYIILFFLSFISIGLYFHIATTFDEKYTLLLISHNFSKLIYLDSLDVHPPLYYLVLKYFINITTFWTKSLFIKIIFARLLSLIFSIITIIYICKIFNLYGIRVKFIYEWILFISLPNVLCSYNPYSFQPVINIRMYALGTMIVCMGFYYLAKINDTSKHQDYIVITVLSSLAMYTHYYAAIIFVMMIFSFIIKFRNNKQVVKKLVLSLISSSLLYIPWLPFLYRQISIPKSQTFNMGRFSVFTHILIFTVICVLLGYPILWVKKHLDNKCNSLSDEIIGTLLLTILFISTILLIIRPMFNLRYIYPILLLYEMYSLNIFFKYMLNEHKILAIGISCILLFNIGWSSYYQLLDVDIPDAKINRNISKDVNSSKRNIILNSKYSRTSLTSSIIGQNHQFEIDKTPINFEYAFFLSRYNKYIFAKHLRGYFAIDTKPAYKPLFKPIYSHVFK